MQNQFESIGVLAPANAEEIDAKIKELKDREELFMRVSREEGNEEETKLVEELKAKGTGEKREKKEKKGRQEKKQEEEEFPSI